MEERPEGAVAAAVVEVVELSLRYVNRYHLVEKSQTADVHTALYK
jgi:hypothetical protein